jgi:zinc transport system substrate-binding protein
MKQLVVGTAATVLTALVITGCSGEPRTGRIEVIASHYPFAWVAEEVGGPRVAVTNLTPPGVEPHDIELTPKQVVMVKRADLIIKEPSFQASLDAATPDADKVLDVAAITRAKANDPHVWLDPVRMRKIADAVATRLGAIDPDHRTAYRVRANHLDQQLSALDHDLAVGLQECARRSIVTSHDAFGYFSERYHLRQIPIAGIDPSNEPNARQLAAITTLVRREHVTTVFTEELVSPAVARTVARETGTRTDTLDPIEALSKDTADDDYLSLMRSNLSRLRKANDCT